MAPADQTLECQDCGSQFVFTEKEQAFYAEKGFDHPPKRCPACRQRRRTENRARRPGPGRGPRPPRRPEGGPPRRFDGGPPRGGFAGPRVRVTIVCDGCGQETTVPFEPAPGRPVYCQPCYRQRQGR